MKITHPNGSRSVDVTHKWKIVWDDVVENDPHHVKFWLTHSHNPPYRNPVRLTEEINIHERDHVEIDGQHFEHLPTGGGYRIWAMRVDEDPGLQPAPISESHELEIKNEKHE
ncbi:uncharacterized protein KD926_010185 [Aspergillus affinis]|uniref:uncharacterized protein n=1 Tax=Aspergillus affinis TaxID=1070780 RepID=UPI0022FF31A8|nr:uncharacterized protein KD926_010185 [Aspergillus affinis]KAI9038852.1 hypothetical protein KD926_010185 [Aspergillus affinis]